MMNRRLIGKGMAAAVLGAAVTGAVVVPATHGAPAPCVFAVTTDFSVAGNSARIDIPSPWATQTGVEPVSSDPVVRWFDPLIYVVNRFGADNIQVIDPTTFNTIREFSVGAGSNPQDIVVLGPTKAYVSRYDVATLLIVNPSTGATTGSINLAPFADPDGIPEMAQMVLDGTRLFVALQRLQRPAYTPLSPSYLVVINTATDTIIDVNPGLPGTQAISLAATNPSQELVHNASTHTIYVAELGQYGVADGGIEAINATTLASLGFITTEGQLGGDVGPIAVASGKGYAIVSNDAFFTNELARFAIPGGARTGTLYSTTGFVPDIEYDQPSSQIFLCDRHTTAHGVHVFSTTSDTRLTASPISTGLPPFDAVVVRPVASDVPAMAAGRLRAWAEPNPFVETAWFRWGGVDGDRTGDMASVEIFDIGGRLVRRLEGAAAADFAWDGRDDGARPVPPGVYLYRLTVGGEGVSGRVIRVR